MSRMQLASPCMHGLPERHRLSISVRHGSGSQIRPVLVGLEYAGRRLLEPCYIARMRKAATIFMLAGVAIAAGGFLGEMIFPGGGRLWSWIMTGGVAVVVWWGFTLSHEIWPGGDSGDQTGGVTGGGVASDGGGGGGGGDGGGAAG
jgi:hypothetical protein